MKREIFIGLFIILSGLFLRFNDLSGRSLWTDEFFTFFQSTGHGMQIKEILDKACNEKEPALFKAIEFKNLLKLTKGKGLKDVTQGLIFTDTHPPLYFWLIYIWMRLFGVSVFAVRFFSVLMGFLLIFAAYKVTKLLFGKNIAVFSALFASMSVFVVRYSQEARSYTLFLLLGFLSWLFLLKFEEKKKITCLLFFSVFSALGLYCHYFYSFIAVAQFIYFTLVYRKQSDLLSKFYLFFMVFILLFLPWVIKVIYKGYNFQLAEWIFGYPGVVNKMLYLFAGISHYFIIQENINILTVFGEALLLFTFIYFVRNELIEGFKKYPRQFLFCILMFLFPLLGMFGIDILQHGALLRQERFWIIPFLGFIPLAGFIFYRLYLKNRLIVFCLFFIMFLFSLCSAHVQFGPAPKEASYWINKETNNAKAVVLIYNIRSAVLSQAYYLKDGIYIVPIYSKEQLMQVPSIMPYGVERIFVCRHYHRTDSSLMNQPFMEDPDLSPDFMLKTKFSADGVSVLEYVKCAL